MLSLSGLILFYDDFDIVLCSVARILLDFDSARGDLLVFCPCAPRWHIYFLGFTHGIHRAWIGESKA